MAARTIIIDGVERRVVDVAQEHGISPSALAMRLRYGWGLLTACTQPTEERAAGILVDGKLVSVAEAARRHGIPYQTAVGRLRAGIPLDAKVHAPRAETVAGQITVQVSAAELAWIDAQPEGKRSLVLRRLIREAMSKE